jgi:two-component system NtrC family sensor kinase
MKFNLFIFSSLFLSLACIPLAVLIFLNARSRVHWLWGAFNVAVGVYGIGMFLAGISKNYEGAFFWWKIALFGVANIGLFFYFTIIEFCGIKQKRIWSYVVVIHGLIFSFLSLASNFIFDTLQYSFNDFYYYKAGFGWNIFFAIWFVIVFRSFILLFRFIQENKGFKATQAKYLFWGMLLGFTSGATASIPSWGIHIYPAWHFLVSIYAAICTYAIFKYQLMDIKLAITRLGVFVFVYSLVLGIPVWLGFKLLGNGLWLVPVTFMGVLATVGPFVYLYIQKRAEDRLLQEQRRYQATLRQASAGMGKIKDLKKLLNMIVYVLTHAIQIEHALVYIYDEVQKKYILGASKRKSGQNKFIEGIEKNSPLIEYFLEKKNSLIFDEINQKALDSNNTKLIQIKQIVVSLEGALLVPIFIDKDLAAIIVMGKKESGKVYSVDDLEVFSILANQTALAIENAIFYEQMNLTHEQLYQAEKMATIGTMADGLSHQINNRFHALGFIAGDALDTVQMNQKEAMSDKMKEVMAELERAFVRIQDNVVQGGEIVQGLLKYTRKGEAGFTAVDADAVFKAALEMVQFKIKTHELKIIREYDPASIPKIKGNFVQLQEVFFNLIDNGYDAMMQRKNEQKEAGYQPTLIVRVVKENNYTQVIFEDNGIGVKDDDLHKLFTPFFTTKLSSKKGTGLGLYVIKKIVEDNHGGRVEMVSKYMQGTQMILRLPIAIG